MEQKQDNEDEDTCFILEPYASEVDNNTLMDQDRDPNDLTTPEASS